MTYAESICCLVGDAGPAVTGEDQLDLLKNEASIQDAIFGVSRVISAFLTFACFLFASQYHLRIGIYCLTRLQEPAVSYLCASDSAGAIYNLQGEVDQLLEVWSGCSPP